MRVGRQFLALLAVLAAPAFAGSSPCSNFNFRGSIKSILTGFGEVTFIFRPSPHAAPIEIAIYVRGDHFEVDERDPDESTSQTVDEGDVNDGIYGYVEYLCGKDSVLAASLQGHARHAVTPISSSGQASQAFALADLNADGIPDTVQVDPTAGGIVVQLRASDGSVLSTKTVAAGFTPRLVTNSAVVVADFNGDGKPDLAVSYFGSDTAGTGGGVFVLLGNGDGTFGAPKSISAGSAPVSLAVADFNGDGKLDLAVANVTSRTVSLLPGNGDGTFGAPAAYPTGEDQNGAPKSILVLDVNGDGAPDLAVGNGSDNSVSVLLNTGGKFGQPIVASMPVDAQYLAYSDFNHDGKLDLAVASVQSSAMVLLFGKGDGTFQPPRAYAVGNSPSSIGVLPFTNGYTALVMADQFWIDDATIFISPTGDLDAPPYNFAGISPASSLTAIAAVDLNGDGNPDVVTTESYSSTPVAVMISQGGTQFNAPVKYALAPNPLCSPCQGPVDIATGDFNGDGKPDVIAGIAGFPNSNTAGLINVLLGNGDGTLRPAIVTNLPSGSPVGQYPTQLFALGDFNRDGKLDVAVAAYGSAPDGSGAGNVILLIGKGDGTFQAPVMLAMPGGLHPVAVAAADLNGDGILDLAVELVDRDFSRNPETLAIFLGQANGTFGAARTFALQSQAGGGGAIAIGDFNRDGKPDIAVSSDYAGPVNFLIDILLGDGAGGFQEVSTLPTTFLYPPAPMVMADLNGDGKPDLVLGGPEGAVLLGNGDGTFQPEQFFASGSVAGLAVTQFSGSKGPDLVIANPTGSWLSLVNNFSAGAVIIAPSSAGPASGSGSSQTFTFTFSDSAGWQNLGVVDVLINSALDGRHACYVAFVPSGASGGSVYLVDDAGDAGGPYQGLLLPSGSGSIGNGQCAITGANSSVNGSGTNLTLTLAISFSASFTGNRIFYLSAQDKSANNSGWQALGTWAVPGAQVVGPAVSGVSPARTSVSGPTPYTFTFTDTNGWQDISVANVLINSAIDGRHACYIAFTPSGAASGSLFLVDDAGDAGGPYAGMTLPATGSVSNSQCAIAGAGASVTGSGNTLTLTLPITFSQAFAGNQVIFLAARSNSANSNWQAVGSATVP
ncbi:MAG TPA: VCBS repeat-containing protein [Bryobacteraceae bacterium]|nr:VCBS repeat-containing protein [Bryobacteraceae bacterium]